MPDKEREAYYLDLLRRCVELPNGDPDSPEPPDFVLGTNPNRVGVELTEYFHVADDAGRTFQETQSLKTQIVSRAERLHASAGGKALYVMALFGHHGRLAKDTVPRIAEQLSNAVLQATGSVVSLDETVVIGWPHLPREIIKVIAHGSVDGVDLLWQPDHVDWVAKIEPRHIQAVIDKKQRIVAHARKHCEDLWLVVAHSFVRGAPCELSEDAVAASYKFAFDRVIWLDANSPRAFDLARQAD